MQTRTGRNVRRSRRTQDLRYRQFNGTITVVVHADRLPTRCRLNRGYDLEGLYSLEEYNARNPGAYYTALSVGSSHNYYAGRATTGLTVGGVFL